MRSINKTVLCSLIAPGLGLMFGSNHHYAGVSFLLNAATLLHGTVQVLGGYYFYGFAYGLYPFLLFYNGGKRLTYQKTLQYNQAQKQKYQAKLRTQLHGYFQDENLK